MRISTRFLPLFILIAITITFNTSAADHKNYVEGKTREFNIPFAAASSSLTQDNTSGGFEPLELVSEKIKKKISEIKEIDKLVSLQKRFIEKLDEYTTMEYPVGISKTIGNLNYTILLNQQIITPQGGTVDAYMSFSIPQSSDSMTFEATGIPLSASGGFSGDIKLSLLSSNYIKLGDNIRLKIIGGENKSFATFNCNGFKNMTIVAEVEFDNSVFLCEDPSTGDIIPNKRLKSEFTIVIENWNNLMVELTLPPFQINGIKGVGFEAKRVALDFSDYTNPSGVVFPADYQSTYFTDGDLNLWRGLYIQQATVRLPSEFNFKKEGSSAMERASLVANNLIIDKEGITGKFEVNYLISTGDMGGWAFTVDKFGMSLEANSIKEASFSGSIKVPMLEAPLNYAATIGMNGDYSIAASTTKANKFSIWAANLTLAPNSTIKIKSVNGKFLPEAILHGELVINAGFSGSGNETDKSKGVSIADIKFQDLHLQTVKPYVQLGSFTFGSELATQSMAGFPLQIKEIGAEMKDEEFALKFRIIVNIADGGFGADGSFKILGEHKDGWKFKGIEVEKLKVNLTIGPLELNGSIAFFKNDAVFGNGFQGDISATFSMGLKLQANAMFGKVNGMRYWYADASAELPIGIPIFTGVAIYGFGGGAYYHMKQAGFATADDKFGKVSSGLVYKPDPQIGLGLKASVIIGSSPKKDVFNGEAGFEIAFNSGGGVRFIAFTGRVSFITPPIPNAVVAIANGVKKIANGKEPVTQEADQRGMINASMLLSYDFGTSTLHGELKTYVNIAGIITGVGPNYSAGDAVMHFSPSEWYNYIGTPDNPIGLNFLGMAETRSYFMAGTKVLASPPAPPEVSSILGNIKTDYMSDLNALGCGKGIAFGSRFTMNTGDLTFLIFYASFKAGLGFDVMLKDYGNTTCRGSSSPIGINGWYANGQAFAYVEGKIGIKVKIFGKKKSVNILDIAMATILQAKLPNPMWLHGAVGGHFSVLGGLVKGNCTFEFVIGEECKIDGNGMLEGTEIIADVTPSNSKADVSVFNAPQAIFNYAVEKPFELAEIDNYIRKYRIKLDFFELSEGSNKIGCKMEWNSEHNVLALKPIDILPGKKRLKASVSVSFEEFKNGNWETVLEKGAKLTETKETEYETGNTPDIIPPSNIQYSYPVVNQLNYYKDESNIGYIKLKQGQDYLFDPIADYIPKGRFVSYKTNRKLIFDISYDRTLNEISFTRPDGLENGEAYHLEIVNVPTNASIAVDANVDSLLTKSTDLSDGNDVTIKTQVAEGELKDVKEKVIFTGNFRTSIHNTFKNKLQVFANSPTYLDYIRTNVELLSLYSWNSEPFDVFEKYGSSKAFEPLVKLEANLTNKWFNNLIYPNVYQNYPFSGDIQINNRDVSLLGIPPAKAIDIFQVEPYSELTEEMAAQGTLPNKTSLLVAYDYYLGSIIDYDANELKSKAANCVAHGTLPLSSSIKALLEYTSPVFIKGDYFVNASYTLPGRNITTSNVSLCMKLK